MAGLLGKELEISIEIEEAEESKFDEAENAKTVKYMKKRRCTGLKTQASLPAISGVTLPITGALPPIKPSASCVLTANTVM